VTTLLLLGSTHHSATSTLRFTGAIPSESVTMSYTSARLDSTLPTLEDVEEGTCDVIVIGEESR